MESLLHWFEGFMASRTISRANVPAHVFFSMVEVIYLSASGVKRLAVKSRVTNGHVRG